MMPHTVGLWIFSAYLISLCGMGLRVIAYSGRHTLEVKSFIKKGYDSTVTAF